MRVTTAFNRMLKLAGASVVDVAFGGAGVIVTVRLRRRRRICQGCGAEVLEIKDRRVLCWRHLDLGTSRCVIECELRRLRCPGCGDRPEMVPWARAGAPYTRDFEDVTAFLAQQMARQRWGGVGRSRPQRRHLAGRLRGAHRTAEAFDQGGVDRHERRL